jgi:uncharacterized membrane protein YcgQ (UPF0703/DUF1980 family)
MDNNRSARNSLIIAVTIMAVTASIFAIYYTKTKKNLENFNSVLGKDETVGFSQVVQTIMNDNRFGTTEEQVRYATLAPNRKIIEIQERMFAAHVSDVYLNTDDYLEKTIKLEGVFRNQRYSEEESFCSVGRYGPGDGCCGPGEFGFEVKWDKSRAQPYPATDSWVEATGVLKVEQSGYYQSLYLELSSLSVLNRRGAENVRQ